VGLFIFDWFSIEEECEEADDGLFTDDTILLEKLEKVLGM